MSFPPVDQCGSLRFMSGALPTPLLDAMGHTERSNRQGKLGEQDSARVGCVYGDTDRGQGQLFKRTLTSSKVNGALTLVPAIGWNGSARELFHAA
jgi:hypothetical protein